MSSNKKFDKFNKKKVVDRLYLLEKGFSDVLEMIDIENIVPNPNQPRKVINKEKLKELAGSIKSDGLLQPIVVVEDVENKKPQYVLIAGERRWRATKLIGYSTIKSIVIKEKNVDKAVLALVENTHRDDLRPIEEANAMSELLSLKNISKKDLAKLVNKSYDHVISLLSIVQLPKEIKEDLLNNDIKISIQALQALARQEDIIAVDLYKEIITKKYNKSDSLKLINNRQPKIESGADNISSNRETKNVLIKESVYRVIKTKEKIEIRIKLPINNQNVLKKITKFLESDLNISKLSHT